MIRVEFDGKTNIPGSLLLTAADLTDASALAGILRDGSEALSRHLLQQFSPQTQQLVAQHVDGDALSEKFQNALLDDLNRQLQGPMLFERQRFRGVPLQRNTLLKALIDQEPQGEDLVRLNRLLLEDVYPLQIAKSPKVEWDAWNWLAEAATAKVIKQWEDWKVELDEWRKEKDGEPPEFDPAWEPHVWKGIRDWLVEYIFHRKCAYCETSEAGYITDAEHFRPKGQVRTKDGIVKTFDVDGKTEITHPGYFWLAYRWENLLPSCNTCNRYGGKKTAFPVGTAHVAVKRITDQNELTPLRPRRRQSTKINGVYYPEPEDLDKIEGRLLLHPYFDYPLKHVYFRPNGRAEPRPGSKQGEASIEVFDLNERNKVAQRSRIQHTDAIVYLNRVSAVSPNEDKMKSIAEEIAQEYFKGERPYAAAVFDSIRLLVGNGSLSPNVLLKDTPYRMNLESDSNDAG